MQDIDNETLGAVVALCRHRSAQHVGIMVFILHELRNSIELFAKARNVEWATIASIIYPNNWATSL